MIYIDTQLQQIDVTALEDKLSPQRLDLMRRFRGLLSQQQCAAAYLLLCEGLRKEYGLEEMPVFEYGEHGKPSIVGHPEIHFNLSHCRKGVICAISDQPVGVDIEEIGRYKDSLVNYTMNEDEAKSINTSSRPDIAFVSLWTMKEAYLKLIGTGIHNDMRHVLHGDEDITTVVDEEHGFVYSVARPSTR